jgi:hypothetical protein
MDSAGITPEEDLQEQGEPGETAPKETPEPEGGEDRLSIFEDFLEKLDLEGPEEGDESEDDKDR